MLLRTVSRLIVTPSSRSCLHRGPVVRRLFTGSRWLARFGRRDASAAAAQPGHVTWTRIGHATIFTLGSCGAIFTGCVVWEYEGVRATMRRSMSRGLQWANTELWPSEKRPEWRHQLHQWWASQSEGQKVFWPICLLNACVFLAWKVPAFAPTMLRVFSSSPTSRMFRLPMMLSAFSHYSFAHLAINMFVLHSFSTGAVSLMGKEQFVGLYLSGALLSSLGSYMYKMVVFSPAVSMGASGAIMAVLGYVCTELPDSRLAIIFLPMFSFTAGTAIKAVVAFDTLGAALRWQFFDHAAHLGGALFGIFWSLFGRQHIWERRETVIRWYHKQRESGRHP